MPARSTKTTRIKASPNFVQALTQDGKAYVAKQTEPYSRYWLNERYRILLSLFSSRHGLMEDQAIDGYFRLTNSAKNDAELQRVSKAIADMRQAEVLIDNHTDTSRYNEAIAAYYLIHRPIPQEIADRIIQQASINASSEILDLAGGPGDLAVKLAHVSQEVSLLELSKGFLKVALKRANAAKVNLQTLHESCNQLIHLGGEYDAITISQAIHWMDDVMVCRGVCRLLRNNGSFFIIHGTMEVDDNHPLAYLLGNNSILGKKEPQAFINDIQPLLKRITLLFDALDSPEIERLDLMTARDDTTQKIVPTHVSLFSQRRPFDLGFAQGFLTDQHIQVTGLKPEAFWQDVEARCADKNPEDFMGIQNWAIMHFQRGGQRMDIDKLDAISTEAIDFSPGELIV